MKPYTPKQILLHHLVFQLRQVRSLKEFAYFFSAWFFALLGKIFGRNYFLPIEVRYRNKHGRIKLKPYARKRHYDFNGILLPRSNNSFISEWDLYVCSLDCYHAYLNNNDSYDIRYINKIDHKLPEGSYCYNDESADITIHPNDVVLDLGAWIGDFAAYACHRGAMVYAFEPSARIRGVLEKTANLNRKKRQIPTEKFGGGGGITVVPFAAGAANATVSFSTNTKHTGSSHLINSAGKGDVLEYVEVVKLDDWVAANNIVVNFIKADIEGAERDMLKGAVKILKTQQPILSLCTYHSPDDPEVMRDIILKANPKYKIIQRRMKLYAYVPTDLTNPDDESACCSSSPQVRFDLA